MIEKKSNLEVLRRDKFLLDMMIHRYDEDVQRNELIDSKNSQMIVVIGVMVTLQSTFFIHLLVEKILVNVHVDLSWKIFLSGIMVFSLILYVITMYIFINAYAFDDEFRFVPKSTFLINKAKSNENEFDIQKVILANFNKAIESNEKIIEKKADKGELGFTFFKISCVGTILFLVLFIYVLFFQVIF